MRSEQRYSAVFGAVAVTALALVLGACSDSGNSETKAEAPAETAAAPETTASTKKANVNLPKAQGSYDQAKLLEPGALPEKVLGAEDAPVTIIEYASTTCGHCANFHGNTYPSIKANYIETGKVRFILREFPFDPRAEAGFMLARCAGDNYFPMVDVLFNKQDDWARAQNASEALLKISRLAGFTQESFEACLTDQKLLDDIRATRQRGAEEFGVDATPTFYINGTKYSGAMSVDEMSAIIDSLL